MELKTYIGRIVAGWILVILGALWCWEAAQVHEPAEGAAAGSFMVIGGALAIRSGVRRRRHQREVLEDARIRKTWGY